MQQGIMGVEFIPLCFSITPLLHSSLVVVQIRLKLSVKWQLKAVRIQVQEYSVLTGYSVTLTGSTCFSLSLVSMTFCQLFYAFIVDPLSTPCFFKEMPNSLN